MIFRFLQDKMAFNNSFRGRAKKRHGLEYSSLEPRTMLAATVTFNPSSSLLIISGTSANDEVYVNDLFNGQIEVEVVGGTTSEFTQSLIEEIDFEGGAGDDILVNSTDIPMTAYGFSGDDTIVGGTGSDFIHGGPGFDTIYGGDGADLLNGHEDDDIIFGGNGNDYIYGGYGDDTIDAGAGNDFVAADWGDDTVEGGDGNDTLVGFTGNDIMHGGAGVDLVYGQHGEDYLTGGAGNDRLRGGPDNDEMHGGADDDYVSGEQGDDLHYGDDGSDTIVGFTGDDYIEGGNGDDFLYGQQDNDTIYGGEGNDVLRGDVGDDIVYGEGGDDYSRLDAGNDIFYGGDGNDRVFGGLGDDMLYGDAGNDDIRGEAGNDTVRGGLGADTVNGGTDNDSVFGGLDVDDTVTGGTGIDRLLVRSSDTVTDQLDDDAVLVFEDVSSTWNEAEVENLDIAFATLFDTPAGIRLLQDSVPSGDLTFYKYDDLGGSAGVNSLQISSVTEWTPNGYVTTYTYVREIHILDWDETSSFYNDQFQSVLIHEIGHNWDSETELTVADPNLSTHFQSFLDISGWTDEDPNDAAYTLCGNEDWWYLNTASFFEPYGQTSPFEDMATTWEFYFSGQTTLDSQLQAKLDLLTAALTELSN